MEALKESMTSPESNTHDGLNVSEISSNIEKYKQIFGNQPVFTPVKSGEKAGFKGWNDPDNLLTPDKAEYVLNRNRNIGIALGLQTERGYTVGIDKESYGKVPNEVMQQIRECSVIEFNSQSGGNNHIITVTKESIEYLERFKEKVYFADNDKHDLEILTSGHCIVPPSRIDEDHRYDNLKVDPQAPTVDLDSIREIVAHIPVSEKNESDKSQTTLNGKEGSNPNAVHQPLPSEFDHIEYFKNNIPGNDSYLERLNTMLDNEKVAELWYGNYEDRSKGELQLRSYVAWYFNADTKMVQYIFEEELPNWREEPLKYELNKHHAKDVITDIENYINRPYYTTGISFTLWNQLAKKIHDNETVTVNELQDRLVKAESDSVVAYKERTIQYALQILVQKDIINRKSNSVYENKGIDEEYLEKLNDLIDEHKSTKIVYNNV